MTVKDMFNSINYLLDNKLIKIDDLICIGGNTKSSLNVGVAYPKIIPDTMGRNIDFKDPIYICFTSPEFIDGIDTMAIALKG